MSIFDRGYISGHLLFGAKISEFSKNQISSGSNNLINLTDKEALKYLIQFSSNLNIGARIRLLSVYFCALISSE